MGLFLKCINIHMDFNPCRLFPLATTQTSLSRLSSLKRPLSLPLFECLEDAWERCTERRRLSRTVQSLKMHLRENLSLLKLILKFTYYPSTPPVPLRREFIFSALFFKRTLFSHFVLQVHYLGQILGDLRKRQLRLYYAAKNQLTYCL